MLNFSEKFPHLEISVLKMSEAMQDNDTRRIDSEFFGNYYLSVKKSLSSQKVKYLRDIALFNNRYSQPQYSEKSNFKIINSQYIRNEFIDYESAKTGFGKAVPKNAILINSTGVGTLGRVNINSFDFKFGVDSHVNVLVLKDECGVNPYFLMIFLQSKYGQSQINRYYSGTSGQIEIYPRDFENFLIPLLPIDFQLEIENLVKTSHLNLQNSKQLYKEAENLLYIELGLDPADPLKSILGESQILNTRIQTLKESFLKTGRLDSEYYQVKFEKIEQIIKNYKGGFCALQELVFDSSGGFAFSSDDYLEKGELYLIRINNIKDSGLDITNAVFLPKPHINLSKKDIVKKGDILISMSGTIGTSCVVNEKILAVVNQRILKISVKNFNENIISLYINSIFGKMQLQQIGTGGVQTNLSTNDILNILIPKIDQNVQIYIASNLQKSFALRKEAKELLDKAKFNIEAAIERERER